MTTTTFFMKYLCKTRAFQVCAMGILLFGCVPNTDSTRDVEFDSCVISKNALIAAIQKNPEKEREFVNYFAYFKFDVSRQCYSQQWKIPSFVHSTSATGVLGQDNIYINFPYQENKGRNREVASTLSGINVVIRPIGAFLTFEAKNEFRKNRLGRKTNQVFQNYDSYLEKGDVSNLGRILIKKKPSDLVALFKLKPNSVTINEASVDSLVTVFTHIDGRFEIYYRLTPKQLNEINAVDSEVKSQLRSYLTD